MLRPASFSPRAQVWPDGRPRGRGRRNAPHSPLQGRAFEFAALGVSFAALLQQQLAQLGAAVDGGPVQARDVLFVPHGDVAALFDELRDLCGNGRGAGDAPCGPSSAATGCRARLLVPWRQHEVRPPPAPAARTRRPHPHPHPHQGAVFCPPPSNFNLYLNLFNIKW